VWLASGQLHDVRFDPGTFSPQLRLFRAFDQLVRRDHFRDDETGSKAFRNAPEGDIGDSGERCENGCRFDPYGTDAEALSAYFLITIHCA
jgi:hypothetical protein